MINKGNKVKSYQVNLKSTTYRDVMVDAEDEDSAVDAAVASLKGDASDAWLENAETESVTSLEEEDILEAIRTDIREFYEWQDQSVGLEMDEHYSPTVEDVDQNRGGEGGIVISYLEAVTREPRTITVTEHNMRGLQYGSDDMGKYAVLYYGPMEEVGVGLTFRRLHFEN